MCNDNAWTPITKNSTANKTEAIQDHGTDFHFVAPTYSYFACGNILSRLYVFFRPDVLGQQFQYFHFVASPEPVCQTMHCLCVFCFLFSYSPCREIIAELKVGAFCCSICLCAVVSVIFPTRLTRQVN